jgi:hypothetical protein
MEFTTMEHFNYPPHAIETLLYIGQAVTYGIASWRCRRHSHPPYQVYLASCVIHVLLGSVLIVSI